MENFFAIFPRYGKFLGDFSTLWKTFFHSVENGTLPLSPNLSPDRRSSP
jgi:hypothetical protein